MGFGQTVASVARYALVTAVSTTLLYAGADFVITKNTPTGVIVGTPLLVLRTGSGGQNAFFDVGGNLNLSGSIASRKLPSCSSLQTTSTGMVTCSTSASLTQTAGDARYVNTSGDTMTGALKVRATLSGTTLVIDRNGSFSGSLIVKNTISGSSLHSFGLGDCDTAGTSKLLWDVTTGKFSCGTDQSGGQTSTAKTANYTAACNDLVVGDSRGGSFTVTLPAASADCKISTVMKHNNTSNTIYIKTPSAAQLILDKWQASGGVLNVAARSFTGAIPLYGTGDTLGLHSDGTNWYVVTDTRIRHSASMKKPSTQSITFADNLVTLDHVTSDIGRLADTTNNRITIRRSGNYLITGECPFANTPGTNQTNECQIWVNGAKIQANSGFENNSGVPIQPNVTYQMWLNKNDYVQLYANAVNTTNLGGANEWANLSVSELR